MWTIAGRQAGTEEPAREIRQKGFDVVRLGIRSVVIVMTKLKLDTYSLKKSECPNQVSTFACPDLLAFALSSFIDESLQVSVAPSSGRARDISSIAEEGEDSREEIKGRFRLKESQSRNEGSDQSHDVRSAREAKQVDLVQTTSVGLTSKYSVEQEAYLVSELVITANPEVSFPRFLEYARSRSSLNSRSALRGVEKTLTRLREVPYLDHPHEELFAGAHTLDIELKLLDCWMFPRGPHFDGGINTCDVREPASVVGEQFRLPSIDRSDEVSPPAEGEGVEMTRTCHHSRL